MTNYGGSGGYQRTSLTIDLQVLVYELKADRKDDFKVFYRDQIKPWLAQNYVAHANAWIVGEYLIVVGSQNPPWGPKGSSAGIPGLEDYVESTDPVPMEELPSFTLTPGIPTESYAAD